MPRAIHIKADIGRWPLGSPVRITGHVFRSKDLLVVDPGGVRG